MFGLPTLRRYTTEFVPAICNNPPCGDIVALANPLVELTGNHFTLGVATSKIHILGWGSLGHGGGGAGVAGISGNNKRTRPTAGNIKRAIDPVLKIPEMSDIIKVSCNTSVTFLLTEKGYLYASGNDVGGITGNGNKNEFTFVENNVINYDLSSNDVYGGYCYVLILKKDGKVYGKGINYGGFGVSGNLTTTTYLGIDNIKAVFCNMPENKGKSFALKTDGTVWATGYNTDGVLGIGGTNFGLVNTWNQVKKSDGTNLTNIKHIITSNWVEAGGANEGDGTWGGGGGNSHQTTIFLSEDGKVYSTGNNKFGQLGLGLATNVTKNTANQITTLTNIKKIASCCGGTSFLAYDGSKIFTWGNNDFYQLGSNDNVDKNAPYDCGSFLDDGEIILNINGGGPHNIINGAFVMNTNFGNVYSAGYNSTYALGFEGQSRIKTFTKHPYFGPDPSERITDYNDKPENYSERALIFDLDLCGYGTEMAQKAINKEGILFMSGWNQNVDGTYNFNQNIGTQYVKVPAIFKLTT